MIHLAKQFLDNVVIQQSKKLFFFLECGNEVSLFLSCNFRSRFQGVYCWIKMESNWSSGLLKKLKNFVVERLV